MQPVREHDLINLLNEACTLHQEGRLEQAETLYRDLLALLPEVWQIKYNLGLLLGETGRHEEALLVYEEAAQNSEADKDLFFNLGICQKRLQRYSEAVRSYHQALDLAPDDIDIHYNLACCLMESGHAELAISQYEEVLVRKPHHLPALNNQAYLCHKTGRVAKAASLYSRLVELDPANEGAAHMLAALTGAARSRAPEAYVRALFDDYSAHFETCLVDSLHYRVPVLMKSFVIDVSTTSRFGAVVDLGCGTGLLGEQIRPMAGHLTGVDLSERMLQAAQQKGLYDELVLGEIGSFLEDRPSSSYDLLLAADVLTYLGDLDDLFESAWHASIDGGLFCFSVEDPGDDSGGVRLGTSGRFAHAYDYIIETARQTGWRPVAVEPEDLRLEGAAWIKGRLHALRKERVT